MLTQKKSEKKRENTEEEKEQNLDGNTNLYLILIKWISVENAEESQLMMVKKLKDYGVNIANTM